MLPPVYMLPSNSFTLLSYRIFCGSIVIFFALIFFKIINIIIKENQYEQLCTI